MDIHAIADKAFSKDGFAVVSEDDAAEKLSAITKQF